MKEGFGVQKSYDDTKYEGEWKQGKKHGKGTLWVKKSKKYARLYAGEWAYDHMEGTGNFYYDNNDVYRGSWYRGKRHGKGIMDYPNGDVFEGEWVEDKREGPGIFYSENGNVYEGYWRNDMKEGPGRFFYSSTRKVYEGEWLEDSPRCGEFREPTKEEEHLFKETSMRKAPFTLPDLALDNPKDVINHAIANTRLSQSTDDQTMRGEITNEMLQSAEKIFHSLLPSELESVVRIDVLEEVFRALGVDNYTDIAADLSAQLELDDDTELSFPEVVDIASFIRGHYNE